MISDTGYWTEEELPQHQGTYSENLAEWISSYFLADLDKQVIDFGCGLGTYSSHLLNRGFNLVIGIEGSVGGYSPDFVKKWDLSSRIQDMHQYPGLRKNSYNSIYMNKYLVEFLGTLLFIYVILATGNPLAIGATLALVILIAAPISGGHINPVVSVVMASAGKIEVAELLPYVVSQVLGGLVALELYKRYKM